MIFGDIVMLYEFKEFLEYYVVRTIRIEAYLFC